MNPAVRAHRILKRIKVYTDLDGARSAPGLPEAGEGEALLGVYRNASGSAVLFTSVGIRIDRGGGRWGDLVRYAELRSSQVMQKGAAHEVVLRTDDGSFVMVPIEEGSAPRFFDAFAVLRFFDRTISDLQEERRP
ncbi:MAG: hypothetical protein ACREP7_12250 [Lysobacter sp.]